MSQQGTSSGTPQPPVERTASAGSLLQPPTPSSIKAPSSSKHRKQTSAGSKSPLGKSPSPSPTLPPSRTPPPPLPPAPVEADEREGPPDALAHHSAWRPRPLSICGMTASRSLKKLLEEAERREMAKDKDKGGDVRPELRSSDASGSSSKRSSKSSSKHRHTSSSEQEKEREREREKEKEERERDKGKEKEKEKERRHHEHKSKHHHGHSKHRHSKDRESLSPRELADGCPKSPAPRPPTQQRAKSALSQNPSPSSSSSDGSAPSMSSPPSSSLSTGCSSVSVSSRGRSSSESDGGRPLRRRAATTTSSTRTHHKKSSGSSSREAAAAVAAAAAGGAAGDPPQLPLPLGRKTSLGRADQPQQLSFHLRSRSLATIAVAHQDTSPHPHSERSPLVSSVPSVAYAVPKRLTPSHLKESSISAALDTRGDKPKIVRQGHLLVRVVPPTSNPRELILQGDEPPSRRWVTIVRRYEEYVVRVYKSSKSRESKGEDIIDLSTVTQVSRRSVNKTKRFAIILHAPEKFVILEAKTQPDTEIWDEKLATVLEELTAKEKKRKKEERARKKAEKRERKHAAKHHAKSRSKDKASDPALKASLDDLSQMLKRREQQLSDVSLSKSQDHTHERAPTSSQLLAASLGMSLDSDTFSGHASCSSRSSDSSCSESGSSSHSASSAAASDDDDEDGGTCVFKGGSGDEDDDGLGMPDLSSKHGLEMWEENLVALNRGVWTPEMENIAAFKRYRPKQRNRLFSQDTMKRVTACLAEDRKPVDDIPAFVFND
eukprot:m51a1_g5937 hypothetical protein (775) ;mRNA; r:107574-110075